MIFFFFIFFWTSVGRYAWRHCDFPGGGDPVRQRRRSKTAPSSLLAAGYFCQMTAAFGCEKWGLGGSPPGFWATGDEEEDI
jgi:hypothetical protein